MLEEESRRKSELKRRARAADEKEREIASLQDQLSQLQQANTRFQDQLWKQEQQLKQQRHRNIDPEALRGRLDDVMRAARTGKV